MKIPRGLFQLSLCFIVGVGATVVEWGAFYIPDVLCGIHYTFATVPAFAVS